MSSTKPESWGFDVALTAKARQAVCIQFSHAGFFLCSRFYPTLTSWTWLFENGLALTRVKFLTRDWVYLDKDCFGLSFRVYVIGFPQSLLSAIF